MTTAQDAASISEAPSHGVTLTDAAAVKAKALLDQEGRDDMHLRIAVQPGGCAGLRYQLFFDERSLDGDALVDFNGMKVAVDRMSAPYVEGAVIDFVDTIEKQGFTIDNPNAGGSCACGDSFHYGEQRARPRSRTDGNAASRCVDQKSARRTPNGLEERQTRKLDAVLGEAFDLVGAPLVDLPGCGRTRSGQGVLGVGQREGELRAVVDQLTHRGRLRDRHVPTVCRWSDLR